MPDATFARPDLTNVLPARRARLEVTGSARAPPLCAGMPVRGARFGCCCCRRCGCEGVPRDTVARRLAHEPFGWRPTTLLVSVCRYRWGGCGQRVGRTPRERPSPGRSCPAPGSGGRWRGSGPPISVHPAEERARLPDTDAPSRHPRRDPPHRVDQAGGASSARTHLGRGGLRRGHRGPGADPARQLHGGLEAAPLGRWPREARQPPRGPPRLRDAEFGRGVPIQIAEAWHRHDPAVALSTCSARTDLEALRQAALAR